MVLFKLISNRKTSPERDPRILYGGFLFHDSPYDRRVLDQTESLSATNRITYWVYMCGKTSPTPPDF